MDIIKIITSPLQTNTYLIFNNNECIVVDPGGSASEIIEMVEKNNCKISAVLLTHCHADHANGCKELQDYGAKIYLGKNDLELTTSFKNLSSFMNLKFNHFTPDVLLNGSENLGIAGLDFKVLATPGHTAGGVCYIIDDKKVIFSGDTLFCGSYGRVDFPTGSFKEMKNSLNKLFELKGDYKVFPGHGEMTTLENEKANKLI